VPANSLQPRHPFNNVHGKTEAVDVVVNSQLQWRVDAALFLVAAYMNVFVVPPSIRQAMNQLRIAISSVPTLCEQNQLVIGNRLNFVAQRLRK
jgi:hypothetical protein